MRVRLEMRLEIVEHGGRGGGVVFERADAFGMRCVSNWDGF